MEAFLCFAGGGGTVELKTLQVHSLFSSRLALVWDLVIVWEKDKIGGILEQINCRKAFSVSGQRNGVN